MLVVLGVMGVSTVQTPQSPSLAATCSSWSNRYTDSVFQDVWCRGTTIVTFITSYRLSIYRSFAFHFSLDLLFAILRPVSWAAPRTLYCVLAATVGLSRSGIQTWSTAIA